MSERVKLSLKNAKFNVKVKEQGDAFSEETDTQEDFLKRQLENQFQAGYKQGYDAAMDELEKAYSEKLIARFKDIHNITAGLEHKMLEFEEHYESVVIRLSTALAERILKREIENHTIIDDTLKNSLKKIIGANNIIIKINPADLADLSDEAKKLMDDSAFSKIKFEPEPGIDRGGCYIESEIGNVDSRLTTQLNELKKNMDAAAFHIVNE